MTGWLVYEADNVERNRVFVGKWMAAADKAGITLNLVFTQQLAWGIQGGQRFLRLIGQPAQPDFVVGPAGTQGVTHTTIQAAVDAAIIKRTNKRQYIAIMPGEYQGTVYIPAATGSLTLYGMGEKPLQSQAEGILPQAGEGEGVPGGQAVAHHPPGF